MDQSCKLVEAAIHKVWGEEAFHTGLDRACLRDQAFLQECLAPPFLRASLEDTSWDILAASNRQAPFELLEVPACQGASAFQEGIIAANRREAILTFLFI